MLIDILKNLRFYQMIEFFHDIQFLEKGQDTFKN